MLHEPSLGMFLTGIAGPALVSLFLTIASRVLRHGVTR